MRQQGTVTRWDSLKGFSFIRAKGMQDIFFHVHDFRATPGATPKVGMKVDFETIHVGGKGPRAMAVQTFGLVTPPEELAPPPPVRRPVRRPSFPHRRIHTQPPLPASDAWIALPLMLAYAAMLVWSVWRKELPSWVLPASFGLNVAAFFAYWQDKYAAQQRRWRISENSLHWWSAAGGWGGAWFAQQVLRHKSRKERFRSTYWLTVVMHCVAVGLWASPELRSLTFRLLSSLSLR